MKPLSHRTANFTDSVIRRMTRVSMKYSAMNLAQGFPDFEPPKPILDRLAEVAHEDYHQYSITWGAQNFREALANKQSKLMGMNIDPNGEIVVTCGGTEAMMTAVITVAMVTGLNFGQDYYDDLLAKYTHKRQLMCDGLDAIGLKHKVPEGAYYIMIDMSEFMKKTGLDRLNDIHNKL